MLKQIVLASLLLTASQSSSAVSVDWTCRTEKQAKIEADGTVAIVDAGFSEEDFFVIDFGSGRLFGKKAPMPEDHAADRPVLAEATFMSKGQYYVLSKHGDSVRFLTIRESVRESRKPFTLLDSESGLLFTGTCVLGRG